MHDYGIVDYVDSVFHVSYLVNLGLDKLLLLHLTFCNGQVIILTVLVMCSKIPLCEPTDFRN